MKVLSFAGREDIAVVYVARMNNGNLIEFVESLEPPIPRNEKWVVILSTLFGCPVKCTMCDAGGYYTGKLTKEEMLTQIDFLVKKRFAGNHIPIQKFKVQFARMGEPAFNENVLSVLENLPFIYDAPGLMPCVSTIAPAGREDFFRALRDIKHEFYGGRFQLQFSLHSTDENLRDVLIPIKKWGFADIAEYGETFFNQGDRKITLNFALAKDAPLDVDVLLGHFDPKKYFIKITPLNPTYKARENNLKSYLDANSYTKEFELVERIRDAGYEVLISIGETKENAIGSNCGQYIMNFLKSGKFPAATSYSYQLKPYEEDDTRHGRMN